MIAPASRCETNHIPVEVDVGDEWAQRVATAQRRGARIAYAKALADRYDGIYITPEHTPEREARNAMEAPLLDAYELMRSDPKAEPRPPRSWYSRLWNFLFG